MAKRLKIDTSLKFRKSIFSLLWSLIKFEVVIAVISIALNLITGTQEDVMPEVSLFVLVSILGAILICLRWHFDVVKIRGSNLELKSGVIFQNVKAFSIEHIQEIKINQSIIGRIFKYGDLIISAPTIDESIVIKSLDSVWRLYKILDKYTRDKEKDGFVITN